MAFHLRIKAYLPSLSYKTLRNWPGPSHLTSTLLLFFPPANELISFPGAGMLFPFHSGLSLYHQLRKLFSNRPPPSATSHDTILFSSQHLISLNLYLQMYYLAVELGARHLTFDSISVIKCKYPISLNCFHYYLLFEYQIRG